jgi:hypothetical protein
MSDRNRTNTKDCQGSNRITGATCYERATNHIVDPSTLRLRHFCKAHAWRFIAERKAVR